MKWPFVARSAYDLALRQIDRLQERNDRLTEAISRTKQGDTQVMMPREAQPLEVSHGWFDVKDIKNARPL